MSLSLQRRKTVIHGLSKELYPRLQSFIKHETKIHYLKMDFEKWGDENYSVDNNADVNLDEMMQ